MLCSFNGKLYFLFLFIFIWNIIIIHSDHGTYTTEMLTSASVISNTLLHDNVIHALSLYFESVSDLHEPSNYTLELAEVNNIINKLTNLTVQLNSQSTFISVQPPHQDNNVIILGAAFTRGIGGQLIDTLNIDNIINSNVDAAAIIDSDSLIYATSIKTLIISKPSIYRYIYHPNDKIIVSPIIVVSVDMIGYQSSIYITLYFKFIPEYKPNTNGRYLCSFYDTTDLQWSESGCSKPHYNKKYDRYECSCNHLTTFGLTWLPNTSQLKYLIPPNFAALVFLSISILFFIGVIIYNFIIRFINPAKSIKIQNLLPLISSASTTILFIFYIALSMTVYNQTSLPLATTSCFTSANVLMFFVYFFLIFMFCVKISVVVFNLFPEPSYRKLFIMLIISFFLAITWTSFAAGFNSNSSYNITQLYENQFCWFTENVIYYFVSIPLAIFILLNFVITIFFVVKIINRDEQMLYCIFVLLCSSYTQGIAWLFGSFISSINPTGTHAIEWIFIILNGLEGIWTLMLYIIIQSIHVVQQKHENAYEEIVTASAPPPPPDEDF